MRSTHCFFNKTKKQQRHVTVKLGIKKLFGHRKIVILVLEPCIYFATIHELDQFFQFHESQQDKQP